MLIWFSRFPLILCYSFNSETCKGFQGTEKLKLSLGNFILYKGVLMYSENKHQFLNRVYMRVACGWVEWWQWLVGWMFGCVCCMNRVCVCVVGWLRADGVDGGGRQRGSGVREPEASPLHSHRSSMFTLQHY